MEYQARSPEKAPKEKALSFLWHFLASFYRELISQPLRSGLIYFLAGLIPALFIGWILFPMALYSKQPQPVNFSHAIHMDPERVDGIEGATRLEKCLFCHPFRNDGTFSGVPKLESCMQCHDDPETSLGETPDEKKFLRAYVANEQEVPWLIYSRQPDNVYFSHISHVKITEIECRTCHGDYGKIDKLPLYKKNRLSGYSIDIWGRNITGYKRNTWDRMKMDDCAQCHTREGREENNACFVCHK